MVNNKTTKYNQKQPRTAKITKKKKRPKQPKQQKPPKTKKNNKINWDASSKIHITALGRIINRAGQKYNKCRDIILSRHL